MSVLTVEFTKGDDRDTIACVRPDGSRTWSRVVPSMVLHDLTHYAVESTLRLSEGFYGMLLAGWDITAFNEPGSTARLPDEAIWTEHVVNLVLVDSVNDRFASIDLFNIALVEGLTNASSEYLRPLTGPELDAIRAKLADLRARWAKVEKGGRLELSFKPPARNS